MGSFSAGEAQSRMVKMHYGLDEVPTVRCEPHELWVEIVQVNSRCWELRKQAKLVPTSYREERFFKQWMMFRWSECNRANQLSRRKAIQHMHEMRWWEENRSSGMVLLHMHKLHTEPEMTLLAGVNPRTSERRPAPFILLANSRRYSVGCTILAPYKAINQTLNLSNAWLNQSVVAKHWSSTVKLASVRIEKRVNG